MLRRIWLITIMSLSPVLLIGYLLGANLRRQPSQRATQVLELYLSRVGNSAHQFDKTLTRSRFPNRFSDSMSVTNYSEGWYYQTAHALLNVVATPTPAPISTAIIAEIGVEGGKRALIYPPTEAWCVTITQTDNEDRRYLLLAQHQDLYNAEWVVHELTTDKDRLAQILAEIGCG
jgi:hypothetical protein